MELQLYAYFPLHWIALDTMLQAINLKVFTWMNSDFMTGVLGNTSIDKDTKSALEYIQMLESRGYNYTSACEWVTLTKGIVRKTPLVKAMSEANPNLSYLYSESGMAIHKAALEKFSGANENALKNKTIPELVIEKWCTACKEMSQKDATKYIISFIEGIGNDDLREMVSPSEYKRGCGKKKEVFVKEQFERSYQTFQETNPLKPEQNEKTYKQWITEDYIFCTPVNPKVDMMMVGSYRCNLKVHTREVMLEAISAEVFLRRGYKATDPDGISVTLLDSDLPKKLVIVEDLNLYLALQQETLLEDDNVVVEILNDLPRAKRWSF